MSDTVPENKVKAIEDLGAQVVIHGASYDEAELHALGLQQREQLTMVHPFDDPAIIAGQGTVGLEILQEISDIDTVIIPLSGGGLFSGIAIAMKYTRPDIHLVGVTMERGPAMVKSLNAGRVVEVLEEPTLADALVGGIGFENTYTFSIVQELMDESILVSEKEISNAMVTAYLRDNLTIEGGGAVGLAALMNQSVLKDRKNIVAIVSGGNVELPLLHKLIQEN
jgi:threonine dehydratase